MIEIPEYTEIKELQGRLRSKENYLSATQKRISETRKEIKEISKRLVSLVLSLSK